MADKNQNFINYTVGIKNFSHKGLVRTWPRIVLCAPGNYIWQRLCCCCRKLFYCPAMVTLLSLCLAGAPVAAADPDVLFRENFDSLAQWEPLTFPNVKVHSTYSLVREGNKSILKAESRASASALVYRRTFNIYENPRIRWRWRVTELSDRGNPKEKAGDDYPIRIYVMFQYDPEKATLGDRLVYGTTKTLYGKYPPHSTLNYVWMGRNIPERYIVSPYTEKARMVILERGKERLGRWVEESVNVLYDYRQAFGKDPPAIAGIAVMSDTDNTGENAVACLDYIEVGKDRP